MTGPEGRTAVVTGAGRGIGRAIALRLAAEGAVVAVHYGTDESAAAETVRRIRAAGGRAFAVRARFGEPGDARTLWAGVDAGLAALGLAGGVDILVNNAGVTSGDLRATTPEEFDRVFAVNVKAPFFVVREGLDRLREDGRIVNVSSVATRVAYPQRMVYAMTKGALETFGLALAKELGPRGITVNTVSPGVIETDLTEAALRDAAARARTAAWSVFDRVGRTADVTAVVAFLVSREAGWVTGQVIDASGGLGL
ncbi:3-oxoacyl-[acyl-carrier protein] reductase [Streptomyces sp. 1114.5]|uniref:SDR family oxidoreductase n=1 Tax=Streptomyces sp. 1114.5 TaxID=1938830 RepID=UPI000EABB4A5|nr:SDR family oxidoreductase [Streptomyces sp. 1114.5]RKT19811.1 3-oxoacyl-[acyl-carrier protein] reductase [Streptomyces sp. 1114.5]